MVGGGSPSALQLSVAGSFFLTITSVGCSTMVGDCKASIYFKRKEEVEEENIDNNDDDENEDEDDDMVNLFEQIE